MRPEDLPTKLKPCRVSYSDSKGIEHAVTVEALNRYHAFGLAYVEFRKSYWSNPDFASLRVKVELRDGGRWPLMPVTRQQFEAWLNQPTSKDEKARNWLKMALGLMEPGGDFKRGHAR